MTNRSEIGYGSITYLWGVTKHMAFVTVESIPPGNLNSLRWLQTIFPVSPALRNFISELIPINLTPLQLLYDQLCLNYICRSKTNIPLLESGKPLFADIRNLVPCTTWQQGLFLVATHDNQDQQCYVPLQRRGSLPGPLDCSTPTLWVWRLLLLGG